MLNKSGSTELTAAFARLDVLLLNYLRRLRQTGRSALGETIEGPVIEDSEAEGLLAQLIEEHQPRVTPLPTVHGSPETQPALRTFRRAAELFDLTPFDLDLLLMALAVEVDLRYARLIAYLNDHAAMLRPTVGLALSVLGGGITALNRLQPGSPLQSNGLVAFDGDAPLSGQTFRIPEEFWPALLELNDAVSSLEGVSVSGALGQLVLDPAQRTRAEGGLRWARDHFSARLIIRGPQGCGRFALAKALAAELRPRIIVVTSDDLASRSVGVRRDALWQQAALVVRDAQASAFKEGAPAWGALADLPVPVVFTTSEGVAESLALQANPTLELPFGSPGGASAAVLEALLARTRHEEVDAIAFATRFRYSPGRWQAVLAVAEQEAHLARGQDAALQNTELEAVSRALPGVGLGNMAQRLPTRYTRSDLIVSRRTAAEFDLALAWAKHRPQVLETWGLGHGLPGRGFACLFYGPPGTGKTLGAQVLAAELGLDLYRIDLSQTVSKYIGETEKNLARVFDEAANVVLFFDEADALFGKRTEVQDSHDRYANLEVSFLLQRIEAHDGIVILATNLRNNIDDAFLRRLQIVAEFTAPASPERALIWRKHLPRVALAEDVDVDVEQLASRFSLSGGEIRNACLTAGFLAAAEGQTIGMVHLCRGVHRELGKSGRLIDAAAFGPWQSALTTQ